MANLGEVMPTASMVPAASEAVPAGESEALRVIVDAIERGMRTAAQTAPARRDVHPKAHGCVRATFRVLDSLPDALRVGVLAAPRVFQAWIRFSNSSGTPQPDKAGDGRGMAIKLLDVAGSASTTQDFVMINYPAFFVRNAADYVAFQTASPAWRFFFPGFNPLNFRIHELLAARGITSQTVRNPLDIRYWSMTPYRFGDQACKFSARPAGPASPFTAADAPDFLRANLARHLAAQGASFDFLVQLRAGADDMPIEDPTIVWPEASAPFVKVATIDIRPQGFETPADMAFCENLSFAPWHCMDAHRPLGGINRVRRAVYETASRLRHELSHAPYQEPIA